MTAVLARRRAEPAFPALRLPVPHPLSDRDRGPRQGGAGVARGCGRPRGCPPHGRWGPCMTLRLAIVADDLTGALDTATPFALAGLKVVVAVSVDGVEDAIATKADVVAVNTASRALDATAAVESVARAMAAIMRARPAILVQESRQSPQGQSRRRSRRRGGRRRPSPARGRARRSGPGPADPKWPRGRPRRRCADRHCAAVRRCRPRRRRGRRGGRGGPRHAGGADRLERSRRRRRTRARPRPCEAHGRDGARRSLPSDAVDALRPRQPRPDHSCTDACSRRRRPTRRGSETPREAPCPPSTRRRFRPSCA